MTETGQKIVDRSASLPFHTAHSKVPSESYAQTKHALEHYFDRTAADAWRALTSEEKVSRIRQTVREGRDEMRAAIFALLPEDLSGRRLYDAGCGTGALSVRAAERGAAVTAVDLSPTMVGIARERTDLSVPEGAEPAPHRVDFRAGDMVADLKFAVDHVVAMDSLIHYRLADIVAALSAWAPHVRRSVVFTFAPASPALSMMHALGGLFPRGNKAPAIIPVSPNKIFRAIWAEPALSSLRIGRSTRVQRGFYTSQALELVRR